MAKQQATNKLGHSDREVNEGIDEDGGRSAAIAALQTIIDLDPAGGQLLDPDHRTALFRLFMALRSLEYGKVHDMFKPSSVENRPIDSLDVRCNKALIAAAMDVLMQPMNGVRGKSEEEAARYVARIVQGKQNKVFERDEKWTWKTIRGWRQKLNARVSRIDIDDDVNLFHLLRADVQEAGIPPEQIAKELLDMSPW